MRYAVEVTQTAEVNAYDAYRYIAAHSPTNAAQWYGELHNAIQGLTFMPNRCPVAPESPVKGEIVRQLLFGVYRILFFTRGTTIHVIHIRHGARRRLNEETIDEVG